MRLTYPGPHEAVMVPSAGGVVVKRGDSAEFPPEVAKSLIEQGWTEPKKKES